jgi:hypothetical protein
MGYRFVDLKGPTADYYGCAFLNTSSNTFVDRGDGENVFSLYVQVDELPEPTRTRCLGWLPVGFFEDDPREKK